MRHIGGQRHISPSNGFIRPRHGKGPVFQLDIPFRGFQQVRRESREMYESVLADLTESEEKILVDLLTRVKTRLMDGAG